MRIVMKAAKATANPHRLKKVAILNRRKTLRRFLYIVCIFFVLKFRLTEASRFQGIQGLSISWTV